MEQKTRGFCQTDVKEVHLGQPIASKLSQICQAWSFCFLGLGFIVRKNANLF
jgi:hypothetical protein